MSGDCRLWSSLQWLRYEATERKRIVRAYRSSILPLDSLNREWRELEELWRDYRLVRFDLYLKGYIPFPDF